MMNGLKAKEDLSFLYEEKIEQLDEQQSYFHFHKKIYVQFLNNFTNKDEIKEYSKCSYLDSISDDEIEKINNLWKDLTF